MTLGMVTNVVVVAYALLAGLGVVLQGLFLRALERRHPREWEALGRPTITFLVGPEVDRYIRARKYRALNDQTLERLPGDRFVLGGR